MLKGVQIIRRMSLIDIACKLWYQFSLKYEEWHEFHHFNPYQHFALNTKKSEMFFAKIPSREKIQWTCLESGWMRRQRLKRFSSQMLCAWQRSASELLSYSNDSFVNNKILNQGWISIKSLRAAQRLRWAWLLVLHKLRQSQGRWYGDKSQCRCRLLLASAETFRSHRRQCHQINSRRVWSLFSLSSSCQSNRRTCQSSVAGHREPRDHRSNWGENQT